MGSGVVGGVEKVSTSGDRIDGIVLAVRYGSEVMGTLGVVLKSDTYRIQMEPNCTVTAVLTTFSADRPSNKWDKRQEIG